MSTTPWKKPSKRWGWQSRRCRVRHEEQPLNKIAVGVATEAATPWRMGLAHTRVYVQTKDVDVTRLCACVDELHLAGVFQLARDPRLNLEGV